jgi:hypothetical protein
VKRLGKVAKDMTEDDPVEVKAHEDLHQ